MEGIKTLQGLFEGREHFWAGSARRVSREGIRGDFESAKEVVVPRGIEKEYEGDGNGRLMDGDKEQLQEKYHILKVWRG